MSGMSHFDGHALSSVMARIALNAESIIVIVTSRRSMLPFLDLEIPSVEVIDALLHALKHNGFVSDATRRLAGVGVCAVH